MHFTMHCTMHGPITTRIQDKENYEVTTLRIDKVDSPHSALHCTALHCSEQ